MRNSNNKPRSKKLSLSKCPGVCRTYSDLQLAYAQQLQADESIAEFRCNVPLVNVLSFFRHNNNLRSEICVLTENLTAHKLRTSAKTTL